MQVAGTEQEVSVPHGSMSRPRWVWWSRAAILSAATTDSSLASLQPPLWSTDFPSSCFTAFTLHFPLLFCFYGLLIENQPGTVPRPRSSCCWSCWAAGCSPQRGVETRLPAAPGRLHSCPGVLNLGKVNVSLSFRGRCDAPTKKDGTFLQRC